MNLYSMYTTQSERVPSSIVVSCLDRLIFCDQLTKTPQTPINSGFGFNSTADEVADKIDLTGKIIVITDGHSGIGLETTRVLSRCGTKVIVGARDLEKALRSLAAFANVECLPLDLSVPSSIDSFAQRVLSTQPIIDVLINNAGVMATPETRDARGYDFQLTKQQFGIRSFAVHPGRIAETSLMRHMEESEFIAASAASPDLMKSVQQGAATTVWSATSAQLNDKGGVYCVIHRKWPPRSVQPSTTRPKAFGPLQLSWSNVFG